MTRLVLQLSVILIVAKLMGYFFSRYLKQPKVLGELVAGMIIGPYALGAVKLPLVHAAMFPLPEGNGVVPITPELYGIATLASIVLLFQAGLETNLPLFIRYSAIGTIVGLGGVVISFVLGDLLVVAAGFAESFMNPEALFMGAVSTATSVGITASILSEKRKISSPEGVTILAGAVLDDILGVIILAVVVGISKLGGNNGVNWGGIAVIAGKAFGFWLVCTVLGILLAPRITLILKWFRSSDLVVSTSFGLALMLAGISEKAGLAMIIGAYVVGLSLSQTDVVDEIHEGLNTIHQFLVPVFFCVMGMMVDFSTLGGVALFGVLFSIAAVFAKMVGCGGAAWISAFNLRGAVRIGSGMLPRGEVTLIIAGVGLSSGVISSELFGVSIMTIFVASVIAPLLLSKSLEGGSGVRKRISGIREEHLRNVDLDFPSEQVAHFMRIRIEQAFKNEEFFVHRLNREKGISYLRKDNIVVSMAQHDSKLILSTDAEDERLVRFIVLEEILELKDLLASAQKMKSPDSMGTDLLAALFNDEEKSG